MVRLDADGLGGFINYTSPDAGQGTRGRGPAKAWRSVRGFLERFTDIVRPPEVVEVALFTADHHAVDFEAPGILEELASQYGPGRSRVWLRRTAATEVEREIGNAFCYEWSLPGSRLDAAVEHFVSLGPLPEHYMGPLVLRASWAFRLKRPSNGQVLPGQVPERFVDPRWSLSYLTMNLKNRSSVHLELNLPFSVLDDEVGEYIRNVAAAAPVKLSFARFRFMRPNRAGTKNVPKRIPREAIEEMI